MCWNKCTCDTKRQFLILLGRWVKKLISDPVYTSNEYLEILGHIHRLEFTRIDGDTVSHLYTHISNNTAWNNSSVSADKSSHRSQWNLYVIDGKWSDPDQLFCCQTTTGLLLISESQFILQHKIHSEDLSSASAASRVTITTIIKWSLMFETWSYNLKQNWTTWDIIDHFHWFRVCVCFCISYFPFKVIH